MKALAFCAMRRAQTGTVDLLCSMATLLLLASCSLIMSSIVVVSAANDAIKPSGNFFTSIEDLVNDSDISNVGYLDEVLNYDAKPETVGLFSAFSKSRGRRRVYFIGHHQATRNANFLFTMASDEEGETEEFDDDFPKIARVRTHPTFNQPLLMACFIRLYANGSSHIRHLEMHTTNGKVYYQKVVTDSQGAKAADVMFSSNNGAAGLLFYFVEPVNGTIQYRETKRKTNDTVMRGSATVTPPEIVDVRNFAASIDERAMFAFHALNKTSGTRHLYRLDWLSTDKAGYSITSYGLEADTWGPLGIRQNSGQSATLFTYFEGNCGAWRSLKAQCTATGSTEPHPTYPNPYIVMNNTNVNDGPPSYPGVYSHDGIFLIPMRQTKDDVSYVNYYIVTALGTNADSNSITRWCGEGTNNLTTVHMIPPWSNTYFPVPGAGLQPVRENEDIQTKNPEWGTPMVNYPGVNKTGDYTTVWAAFKWSGTTMSYGVNGELGTAAVVEHVDEPATLPAPPATCPDPGDSITPNPATPDPVTPDPATPTPPTTPTDAPAVAVLGFPCVGLSATDCSGHAHCAFNASTNLCHNVLCSGITTEKDCLAQGCYAHSAATVTTCSTPPKCSALTDVTKCRQVAGCRFFNDQCVADERFCYLFSSEASADSCVRRECAYLPSSGTCFATINSPALCAFQNATEALCRANGCLWLTAAAGGNETDCMSWDADCGTLQPASEASCDQLPNCALNASLDTCQSVAISPMQVEPYIFTASLLTSSNEKDEDGFSIKLAGVHTNTRVALVSATGGSCSAGEYVPAPSYVVENATTVYNVESPTSPGSYTVCARSDQMEAYARSSHVVRFNNAAPNITTCVTEPLDAGVDDITIGGTLRLKISGSALSPFGRVAVIEGSSSCPTNIDDSAYLPFSPHTGSSSAVSTSFVLSSAGNYTFCHHNGVGVASCPQVVNASKYPPWLDETYVQAAQDAVPSKFPSVLGTTILKHNIARCTSLNRSNFIEERSTIGGTAMHPKSATFLFGSPSSPYPPEESCVFAVLPFAPDKNETKPAPSAAGENSLITIQTEYRRLNPTDEIRVFVPLDPQSNPLPPCSAFSSEERMCTRQGCAFNRDTERCVVVHKNIPGCPETLIGFRLARLYTRDNLIIDGSARLSVSTSDMTIFAACSTSAPSQGGLGVTFSYETHSPCPDNCHDEFGMQRGVCVASADPLTVIGTCRCVSGYTGSSCRIPTACRSGASVVSLPGGFSQEVLFATESPCSLRLLASQSAGHALALVIRNFTFSSSSPPNVAVSCDARSISVIAVETGKLVKRLCTNNLQDGAEFLHLDETTDSIRLEYVGIGGDSFTVEHAHVSQQCPGIPGSSGYALLPNEVCGGRGTCRKLPFVRNAKSGQLPLRTAECLCNSPYDTSFAFGSCDRCMFGYREDSFPNCTPATACSGCSGHGQCTSSGLCDCNAGFYGIDCAAIDDALPLEVDLEKRMSYRLPLNSGVGNVKKAGGVDRTMSPCALPGSFSVCTSDTRNRGRSFMTSQSSWSRRRQVVNLNTSTEQASSAVNDRGFSFNRHQPPDTFPEFVRTENISGTSMETKDSFTVCSWIRVTPETKGTIIASASTAFHGDGTSPALDRVLSIENRLDAEDNDGKLLDSDPDVNFALLVNGPKHRIDYYASDPAKKGSAGWEYLRSFRMDSKTSLSLFDNSWRFVCVVTSNVLTRKEAQLFVDGKSVAGDPGFTQCLPFLPKRHSSSPSTKKNFKDPKITWTSPFGSLLSGYHFVGYLDELQVYDIALGLPSVVKVGGKVFEDVLAEDTAAASVMIIVLLLAIAVLILSAVRTHILAKRAEAKACEDAKDDEELEDETISVVPTTTGSNQPNPVSDNNVPFPQKQDEMKKKRNRLRRKSVSNGFEVRNSATWVCLVLPPPEEDNAQEGSGGWKPALLSAVKEGLTHNKTQHFGPDYDFHVQKKLKDLQELMESQSDDLSGLAAFSKPSAQLQLLVDQAFYLHDYHFESTQHLEHIRSVARLMNEVQDVDAKVEVSHQRQQGGRNNSSSNSDTTGSTTVDMLGSMWQIISQMMVSLPFPATTLAVWSPFALTINLDFASLNEKTFEPMFAIILVVGVLTNFILAVFLFLRKPQTKEDIRESIEALEHDLEEAKRTKKPLNRKIPLRTKVTQMLTVVAGLIYMPATQQAVAVVSCHPKISCLYDCYNEGAHNALIAGSVIIFVFITIMTPLAFIIIVRQAVKQYYQYIRAFDPEIHNELWPSYVAVVTDPFLSLYSSMRFSFVYTNAISMLFRAILSVFFISLYPGTTEQFVALCVLYSAWSFFVARAQPYHVALYNQIFNVATGLPLVVLFFLAIERLAPHSPVLDGFTMLVLVVTLIISVALLVYVLLPLVKRVLEGLLAKFSGANDEGKREDATHANEKESTSPPAEERNENETREKEESSIVEGKNNGKSGVNGSNDSDAGNHRNSEDDVVIVSSLDHPADEPPAAATAKSASRISGRKKK